jgi:hypothetical protein
VALRERNLHPVTRNWPPVQLSGKVEAIDTLPSFESGFP